VQWPEGFRPDPEGRWDDEIERLSDAADAFDRVANVVQSTLSELCFPLESPSRLQVPSLIRPLGRRHGRRSRCSPWSNRLESSPLGTSDCPLRLHRFSSAAWSVRSAAAWDAASASTVHWMAGVVGKVIVRVILSPFVGFVGGCVDDHRLVDVA
jgi:hypothetical protein